MTGDEKWKTTGKCDGQHGLSEPALSELKAVRLGT
jgi:hypothetical protein